MWYKQVLLELFLLKLNKKCASSKQHTFYPTENYSHEQFPTVKPIKIKNLQQLLFLFSNTKILKISQIKA